MSAVANMVCPSCATLNGRQHRRGCPRGPMVEMDPDARHHYQAGWDAARAQLVPSSLDAFRARLASTLNIAEDTLRHHQGRAAMPPDQAVQVLRAALKAQGLLP